MINTLKLRGPDAAGSHVSRSVALGHSRLSIIDLVGGGQPMYRKDLGLAVTFNGEIYNYWELNRELARLGFHPHTRSDTETLLLAYAAWGADCVKKLNGMFAFVIHDENARLLFAARDRMGEKPLYYWNQHGQFVFGSELKALLRYPGINRELNPSAVARYFLHEFVPSPHCIFEGVRKLGAGQTLIYNIASNRVSVRDYWDIYSEPAVDVDAAGNENYWAAKVRQELEAAVRLRLDSDVPLGVFLSGGIDSAAVAALMARISGADKVKTFSIGFSDPSFDESQDARLTANFIGTRHYAGTLHAKGVGQILDNVVSFMDEPLADASIIPMYYLAQFARQFVTVALSGDGGDELFAGYHTFKALTCARIYNAAVPETLNRRVIRPLANMMPAKFGNFSFDFKVKQFLRGMKCCESQRLWRWLGSFVPEELPLLLDPGCFRETLDDSLYVDIEQHYKRVAHRDQISRDGYVFAKTFLADGVLTKVDRATMASSLESRSPFLDPQFIALASAVPSHLKYRRGCSKYILRKAMSGLLPERILGLPKKGFNFPVGNWLRGELRNRLLDTLNPRRIREGGLLRANTVTRLVEQHLSGARDNRKPLWTLFMFELWREHWMKAPAPAPAPVDVPVELAATADTN